MTVMWQNEVKPRLQKLLAGNTILARTIKLFGLPEADVAGRAESFFATDNPALGIYARTDGIHLRLIAQGDNAAQLLESAERKVEDIFGKNIWGRDDDTLIGLIGRQMVEKGLTLAIMEDSTSGRLANIISSVPGYPDFFRGGLVAPSDDIKISMGVPAQVISEFGAVSGEVAEAMAEAVRQQFSADIGLSTTGILTKQVSQEKRPGLTYIGIADSAGSDSWPQNFARFRDELGQREATGAFYRLRERLINFHNAGLRPEG
jgi:nicotinamide-nucleotide amidase